LLGDIEDRVQHRQIGQAHVAALTRKTGLDAAVLRLGNLHEKENTTKFGLVLTHPSTGPVVVVSNGQTSNAVTFTIPSGVGTISGTVTRGLDGSPIGGASVSVLQSGTTIASANTGLNGTFSFSNLAVGSYDVQVSAAGYVAGLKTGNAVTANTTTTVNLALGVAPTVTSIAPVSGKAGANVTIFGSGFGDSQLSNTVTFNGLLATVSSWSNTNIVNRQELHDRT
jgi:hypothetical protein